MKAEYPFAEMSEITKKKESLPLEEFNAWFDASSIKWRVKKICMKEQRLRCCYCRRFTDSDNNAVWDLEHVLCEKIYPEFFWLPINLAVACKACNVAKGSKDVLQPSVLRPPLEPPKLSESYTIPHPQLTEWEDHLHHTMFIIYEGLTEQGVELIKCCKLNQRAELEAGFSVGAVQVARRENFFQKYSQYVPSDVGSELFDHLMEEGARSEEEARIEREIIKLNKDLGLDQ